MNDIKWVKENIESAKKAIELRSEKPRIIDTLTNLHKKLSLMITKEETLVSRKKIISNEVAKLIGSNREKKIQEVQTISKDIEELKKEKEVLKNKYSTLSLTIPNLVIDNMDDKNLLVSPKIVIKSKEVKRKEKPISHWDIFERLNLARFDWAINSSGSRFIVYVGDGAKLRRSIMNYQSDFWAEKGYLETLPPVLVTHNSMTASGQFPKFLKDAFLVKDNDKVLTGTSEIAICNFFKKSIIPSSNLPEKFSATTLNFRSEVGSAGKDVRGSIRMHQFTKTELFKFTNKESYESEYNEMISSTSELLKSYEIPFQAIQLPFFDLGFHSEKTIDFEVWVPSNNAFREVSSCSKVGTFQSRRASIRHRENIHEPTKLCYTMNGTGVAVDRILLAIVENNFNEKENTIKIPKVLVKYFGSDKIKLEKNK